MAKNDLNPKTLIESLVTHSCNTRKQHCNLIICGFVVCLLVATNTYGQRNISNSYCLGCCGLNAYKLVLFNDQSFEIRSRVERDTTPYVRGKYALTPKAITLDIESVRERVEIKKIKESESLAMHFEIVNDPDNYDLEATSILLKKQHRYSIIYSKAQQRQTITAPFDKTETILFKCIGMNNFEFTITEPGEYDIKVTLVADMKMSIKPGDKRTFRRVRDSGNEKLRDFTDKKIKFLTKECKPIIL